MSQAAKQSIPRRALLSGALALPAIAAVPVIASAARPGSRVSPAWRKLIREIAMMHPNGAKAAAHACAKGMDANEFSGISIHSPGAKSDMLPVLWFGDWQGGDSYFTVTPSSVARYTRMA